MPDVFVAHRNEVHENNRQTLCYTGSMRRPKVLSGMKSAPRDGTLIRLHLKAGGDFIGYYTDRWWGWIAYRDVCPLILGDITFAGWEPVDQEAARAEPIKKVEGRGAAPAIEVMPLAEAPRKSAIVKAKPPRRNR